ncbi:hypothetical protein RIF29_09430 [Crotalaria pallida]|uniref:Uncharacterized protein n=1 Tax=Crotalaria pallida TaxID=3830 RepID=A0AAN9IJN1_CROPI
MENTQAPPPPPPHFPTPFPHLHQPTTNVTLLTTLPFNITVDSPTTHVPNPITFSVTPNFISITPNPNNPKGTIGVYELSHGLLGLFLPFGRFTLPTTITIETETKFIIITVQSVLFITPLPTITIGIGERSLSSFALNRANPTHGNFDTDTCPITLPILLSFNVDANTNTTITVYITISADSIHVSSDTFSGTKNYVASLLLS